MWSVCLLLKAIKCDFKLFLFFVSGVCFLILRGVHVIISFAISLIRAVLPWILFNKNKKQKKTHTD